MPTTGSNEGQDPDQSGIKVVTQGFFAAFFRGLLRDLLFILWVFVIATGASALACWYYGLPLFLSLIGGILALGFSLALKTDSVFD